MNLKYLLIWLLFFAGLQISAQENYTLYFHIDQTTVKQKARQDSTWFRRQKIQATEQFRMYGYTGITLSDSTVKNKVIHYQYSYSHHFKKVTLTSMNPTRKGRIIMETVRDFKQVSVYLDKTIRTLENNGFPFASIQVVNQRENEETLELDYKIDSGRFFIMDEIYVKCNCNVHDKTVANMIGIHPGDVYNESKIREVETIIAQSGLYKLIRAPQLIFKNGRADLYLFLEKVRSSSADGYVGFLQNKNTGKLALNGYINLKLHNSLNRSELIDLSWRNNPDKTQLLHASFQYPFILNSPVGCGALVHLQKQDTTFIRSNVMFNLTYQHPRFTFNLYDEIERSDLLTNIAPFGYRDFKKNTIGASLRYRPKMPDGVKFYQPVFRLSGGFFTYRADTLDDNTRKADNNKYGLGYGHEFKLGKYFSFIQDASFQGLSSSVGLSRNELIFFGGLKSVRGFYELELSGNDVWIIQNEFRFRPVSILSFSLIYDYSSYKNNGQHFTHSGGLGFRLINETFTLEIIVANGVLDDNPFELSNTKVHLGFTSTF